MRASQRQQAIMELIRQRGAVRGGDLVRTFGISDMTIRRDLEALAHRELVIMVHGGATAARPSSVEEPGFAAKSVVQREEKEHIARRAAEFVRPGSAIALSGGSPRGRRRTISPTCSG